MEQNKIKMNSSVIVDGTTVDTYKQEIVSCNMLGVEVGTTGQMGGDSGHGGRTYFKVSDEGCTDIRCVVKGHRLDPYQYDDVYFDDVSSVEIFLGGDSELDTFCEALRIGYEVLKSEASPVDDYKPSPLELRQERFALYVNELCDLYRRTGKLSGMSDIRNKHHITGLTQQQFFEVGLNNAKGYVSRDFCDSVYAFILDTTKAFPTPKYQQ